MLDNPTTLPGNAPKKLAKNKRPPSYRVMLHNDAHNRREYVVRVLLKVVKGITADDAATGAWCWEWKQQAFIGLFNEVEHSLTADKQCLAEKLSAIV